MWTKRFVSSPEQVCDTRPMAHSKGGWILMFITNVPIVFGDSRRYARCSLFACFDGELAILLVKSRGTRRAGRRVYIRVLVPNTSESAIASPIAIRRERWKAFHEHRCTWATSIEFRIIQSRVLSHRSTAIIVLKIFGVAGIFGSVVASQG